MMKKIALVTCYFQPNYGSQLQAFATQLIFDKLGLENETICIDGFQSEIKHAKIRYFISRVFDKNTISDKISTLKKRMAQIVFNDYKKNKAIRDKKFKDFAETRFRLSKKYKSLNEIGKSSKDYSAFVVGSDQLWLPSNIEAGYYTLEYLDENVYKMSLATSFGVSNLPDKQARKARVFLNRFNALSTREKSGVDLISKLTGRTAELICDPTLMFDSEEWCISLGINKEKEVSKYIFVYFLGNNPEQRDFVKKVREKTGMRIIQMQHCDEYISSDNEFADEAPYNVGPTEFVELIKNAEYVFTDSFHCTVFSMLFKKRFSVFRRYSSDSIVSTNGRIYSILSLVGLEDRLLSGHEIVDEVIDSSIDYRAVDEKLMNLRENSWSWLKLRINEAKII